MKRGIPPVIGRIYTYRGPVNGYWMCMEKDRDQDTVTLSPLFWFRTGRLHMVILARREFDRSFVRFDEARLAGYHPSIMAAYDRAKFRRLRWIELAGK